MTSPFYRQYLFFKEHAGYCVGFRAQGALKLARAWYWARDLWANDRLRFRWVEDNHADWSWFADAMGREPNESDEQLGCILEQKCPCCDQWIGLTSLWGICNPDDSYRIVVEAELALEVQA